MKYCCLQKQVFERGEYRLIPIRKKDMGLIRNWRNAQIDILRQSEKLTMQQQAAYWECHLKPSFCEEKPKQILFSFLKGSTCIGYGGLTHLDWNARRGEVSFLLDPSRTLDNRLYKAEFSIFLTLLKEAVFEDLRFHRMFAETFNIRPVHVAVLEKFGFRLEGTLKDHVLVANKLCDSLIHGMINNE